VRLPKGRHFRRGLLPAVVLAGVLVLPSLSGAAESCRTAGATVARNEVARVFSVSPPDGGEDRYACVLRSRRTYYLDSPGTSTTGNANIVRLAGYYVLLDNFQETRDPAAALSTVDVRNLRTGRIRRTKPPAGTVATDFVLNDSGSEPD